MKKKIGLLNVLVMLVLLTSMSCKKDGDVTDGELPSVFEKFESNVSISVDGSTIVIESDGIPNHGSPYFETTDSRYEAYNGGNPDFALNPNQIAEQNFVFRIPLEPQAASDNQATDLGPIGVALNGVPFFNQYAAGNTPLANEINSFDQYNGHPQGQGAYHYHIEPLYLTDIYGEDALLGFLLDGFPVYGPLENGSAVSNQDLDEFHGHSHATEDYPDGIYHYHITDSDPYINGNGYYGEPGTVSL